MPPFAWAGLIVCLAACAAYASTTTAYFLNDDFGVVALLSTKPATYFPRWFVTSWMDTIWGYHPDEIRPFPALSYQLTALPNAGSPTAHHLVNIAIHAANGLLVLALARMAMGVSLVSASIAALVFVLLPVQSESVAWITGRVDSLPALFYLGSVLAYVRWRQSRDFGRTTWALYAAALLLGFLALFSKQNTITLVAALVGYDVLIDRRWSRSVWSWVWPYVPFAAITLFYMYLRYVLFGQVVREGLLTIDWFVYGLGVIERHAWRTIFGHATPPSSVELSIAISLCLIVALCAMRSRERVVPRPAPALAYFVAAWWVLGVAPVLVAGYESPRHVYLASVAWALFIALMFQWTWTAVRRRRAQVGTIVVTAAILGRYAAQSSEAIDDWNGRARISARATHDVEHEALAASEGTLFLVGAPPSAWEWALPFAARPPFTSTDLTARVFIVSPRALHCCRGQWEADTRRTLEAWRARGAAPVIALRWNEETGVLLRSTDGEDPDLRSLAAYLADIPSADDLDRIMTDALRRRLVN